MSEKLSTIITLLLVTGSLHAMALQKPDLKHLKKGTEPARYNHALVGFDSSGNMKLEREQSHDCIDLDNGARDPAGHGCAIYTIAPTHCGQNDDADFKSNSMCCACGGGLKPGRCANIANGAKDLHGNTCAVYKIAKTMCGQFDDADFTSSTMCCACGGGLQAGDECPEHCNQCDIVGRCLECSGGRFLSTAGDCLTECPPGYIGKEGKCERCYGTSSRRRATSCEECPNGHIDAEGSDDCVNMQSFCTPQQCQSCANCLDTMTGPLHDCWASRQPGAECINFDNMWCGQFYSHFMQCESFSMSCYFKLLCNSPCVCPAWKTVRCGGVTNPPGQTCTASMLEELVHLGQSGNTTKTQAMLANEEISQDKFHARESNVGKAQGSMDAALQDKCVDR